MKKTLFSVALFFGLGLVSHAQLAQTKWKGLVHVPDETDGWLSFKKDTLEVFVSNGESLLETMTYTIVRDTLLVKKVSGRSPCNLTITGKYKWSLKDDKLSIVPLEDGCDERLKAWSSQPYVKAIKLF